MMAPLGLTHLSALAAGSLVAAAWEGLLLAGLVAVCLRMLPGISAAARSVVWLAVMVVVAGLPFVHFGGSAATGTSGSVRLDERVGLALVGVWVLLSLVRAAQLVRSAVWLRGIARNSRPVEADAAVMALLVSGRGRVRLCASDEVDRPSVVGFFAPRILVPEALLARLSEDELKQIVLHEIEHLRRGDDWTNLLQKLSLVVFPLNPALIWIERQLCLERELACDDRVMRATGARKAYAACLANLAEHSLVRRGVSLALGAWERQSEVVRRVHRILAGSRNEMGRRQVAGAVAVLMVGVMVGADGLAHAPALVSFGPKTSADIASVAVERSGAKAPLYKDASFVGLKPHANPLVQMRSQDVVFHPATVAVSSGRKTAPVVIKTRARVTKSAVEPVQRAANDVPAMDSSSDEPVVVMVTFRSVESSVRGTIVQDSQFIRYAAVPVRNGWLFVQL